MGCLKLERLEKSYTPMEVIHGGAKESFLKSGNYYPFGLEMNGEWQDNNANDYDYLYNGKEIQKELGLGYYDYGARYYDPSIGRFTSVDPLADVMPNWSPYNYTFNNPILFTDPTGMIPIFGLDGTFLGHYDDESYNGEILVMSADAYSDFTGGQEQVMSMDQALELGATTLTDHIANNIDASNDADIASLENLYTNLIDQAHSDGIIDYNSSSLEGGKINVLRDLQNTNGKAAAAISTFSSAGDRISLYLRSSTRSETKANPYIEGTQSVWNNLTHAGDAINILGVHEPLHSPGNYPGTNAGSHTRMNREILTNKKYKKALEHASQLYLEQARKSANGN